MAGMAEMAQMAALAAKYKCGQQRLNKNTTKPESIAKSGLLANEKSLYKPKQCGWRDLTVGLGSKTIKGLYTHEKPK